MGATSCKCGHPRSAHEHYRPGSECSTCAADDCKRFRPAHSLTGVLAAVRGLGPSRPARSDLPGRVVPLPPATAARTDDDGDAVARQA